MSGMQLPVAAFLILAPAFACAGSQLRAPQRDAVLASWRALTPETVEARKLEALPQGLVFERIDVSEQIRSASFGHTTTLLVPPGGKQFYVEYGRSTNRPGGFFGPFPVAAK